MLKSIKTFFKRKCYQPAVPFSRAFPRGSQDHDGGWWESHRTVCPKPSSGRSVGAPAGVPAALPPPGRAGGPHLKQDKGCLPCPGPAGGLGSACPTAGRGAGEPGRTRNPAATRRALCVRGRATRAQAEGSGAGVGGGGHREFRRERLPGVDSRGGAGRPLAAPQGSRGRAGIRGPQLRPPRVPAERDLPASLASESRAGPPGAPLKRRGFRAPAAPRQVSAVRPPRPVQAGLGGRLPSRSPFSLPRGAAPRSLQRTLGCLRDLNALPCPPRSLPARPHSQRVWPVTSPLQGG